MRPFTVIALFAALGYATPPMSFNCGDRMEDICSNMCWGAYCTEPSFGATLKYDRYGGTGKRDSDVGRRRQRSAGCLPRPNRCSTNGGNPRAGENCDEYPFASTSDADKGGQVSKCVIKKHNDRQGNIIKNYIASSCGGNDCTFIVGFGNPASPNVKYCMAYNDRHNKCIPDGSIFKNGKPDVRPPASRRDGNSTQIGGMYLMKSGMKVAFAENLDVGTKTKHATPKNSTMLAWVDDNDEDEDLVDWDFLDDEIVEKLEDEL